MYMLKWTQQIESGRNMGYDETITKTYVNINQNFIRDFETHNCDVYEVKNVDYKEFGEKLKQAKKDIKRREEEKIRKEKEAEFERLKKELGK